MVNGIQHFDVFSGPRSERQIHLNGSKMRQLKVWLLYSFASDCICREI
jgi:hypothetical protein